MPATLSLAENNGSGGALTDLLTPPFIDIVNMNFGSTDTFNLDPTLWPIRHSLPRSFSKFWRVVCVDIDGASVINDIRIWKSAGLFDNFDNIISDGLTTGFATPPAYAVPVNTSNISGVAIPTADPGAQNIGIGGGANNDTSKSFPANGNYSNFFPQQMQIDVGGTSVNGPLSQKTYTIQYDEA